MARWDDSGRGMSDRAQSRLRRRAGRMRLAQRLDVSMALLWGGTLSLLGLLVLALLVVADLGQWFALPGTRPLADERILENLRTSSGASFVDGGWQSSEERLYVAQSDWTLHRYDPDTRLWSTERPLGAPLAGGDGRKSDGDGRRETASASPGAVESPLALLDGGCGGLGSGLGSLLAGLGLDGQDALNPGAALLAAGREDCPDPSALYALSQEGGLLRRRPAGFPTAPWASPWQVLMGDNVFIGASGAPVEQDSLTTAAVSPDGELLALGSSDGLGLFDTRQRRWIDNSAVHRALGEQRVTHLAFWGGRLWIGTGQGLTPLDADGETPAPAVDERLRGRVLDLDVQDQPKSALWLLQERPCLAGSAPSPLRNEGREPNAQTGDGSSSSPQGEARDDAQPAAEAFPDPPAGECLRLLRLDRPGQPPAVLIDETSRFPALNLDDLHFAQQRDDLLVAAGRAGIYAYQLEQRSWKGLFPRAVTSLLAMPGGSGFYFGYAGGVGVESGGEISTWPLGQDDEIITLRFGQGAEVLALAGNGSLFAFDGAEAPVVLRESTRSALAEGGSSNSASNQTATSLPFQDAVGLLDAVFLAGDSGALLHNVVTRQYVDIAADKVPPWMRAPGRRFFSSDRYLYVLSPQQAGRSAAYILPRYHIEEGDLESHLEPVLLRSPVGPVRDWEGRGIGLIDAAGNALRLHPGGQQRFNGLPQPGLDGLPLLDAAAQGDRLTLVTSAGLQTYDSQSRSWSGFISPPLDAQARQAAYYNDQLLVLHQDGRLGRTTSTAHVIGDQRGFSMGDDELSDVYQQGRVLYLAGAGAVEAYDPLLRRIIARWRPGGGDDVEVLGTSGSFPVSLTRGALYRGNDRLDTGRGRVLSASLRESRLWMLMEQGGTRFVRSQAPAAASATGVPPVCFFRRPSAGPQVRRLLDAARLQNGMLAVASDAGLRFYDPASRSWTDPPPALRDFPARRVRSLGRQILAWTGEDDPDANPPASGAGRTAAPNAGAAPSTRSSAASGEAPVRLAILSQDALQWPDSCSQEAAALRPKASIQWRDVLDLTLSPDGSQAAWLRPDQAVEQLSGGQIRTLLDGRPTSAANQSPSIQPSGLPAWDRLQALYDRTQAPVPYLMAAQAELQPGRRQNGQVRLWSYRLDRRSWRPVELSGLGGDDVAHLNLLRDAATELVTVRGRSGSFYRGVFQPLSPQGAASASRLTVPLSLLYAPSPPLPQAAPPLDVQGSGNLWTLVLPQGVFHYNALRRRWLPTALRLPAPDPTLLLRRAGGRLVAVADSGSTWHVADDESDTPLSWTRRQGPGTSAGMETPAALAVGWMRWDRAGSRFMLTTPDGVQDLTAAQSLDASGRRYFFETVEAVLASDEQTLYAANDFGLWMHPQPQLGLGDAGVTYRPVTLGQPLSARGPTLAGSSLTFDASDGQMRPTSASANASSTPSGGRSATPTSPSPASAGSAASSRAAGTVQDGASGPGSPAPGNQPMTFGGTSRQINLGPLLLTSAGDGSGLRLTSRQDASGGLERGFPWDAPRRQVAYDASGNLVLLTDNGPHSAQGFASAVRPPGRPLDPVLLSDDTWTWRRLDGSTLDIRRADGNLIQHGYASVPGASGYSFTSDRLNDAAFHQDTLWLLSQAGLHKTSRPSTGLRWQNIQASRLTHVQGLDRQPTPEGPALLALTGQAVLHLQGSQWQAPSPSLLTGLMVDSPRLRFQRSASLALDGTADPRSGRSGSQITKLLRLESALGASEWVPFRWHRGRFPFDVVTSITTHGQRLLLGTQAGLQIYSSYADGGLDTIDHIHALGTAPSEGLRVEQVGIPPGQTDAAVAEGQGFCLSVPLGGNPGRCTGPPPQTSLRADTPLWRWTASGGRVEGRYKLSAQPAGPRVTIRAGRLPHDRLTDLASFESSSFFLWDEGRVSFHPRGGGRLQDMRIYGGFPSPPRGFAVVQEQPGGDPPPIPAGLYLRLTGGNALRWQSVGQSWRPLEAEQARQLDRHLEDRPVFRQGRLRLVEAGSDPGRFRFQYRTPQGSWQPLSWRRGRLEIDIWNDFVPHRGQIWSATPAGLAAFRRGAEQVRLDPSSFRLIRGPLDSDGNILPVTDMQSDGPSLSLRCNSDSRLLFQANLDRLDDGRVFTPLQADDPFAQQTLVQTDYWQWRRQGRRGGSPGVLRFTFKGRESGLAAGRFDFDTLTSLALFGQGHLETATQSAGWLRYPLAPRSDTPSAATQSAATQSRTTQPLGLFHPANLIRPRETAFDPAGIQRLHLGRALDQPALCLSDAEGRAWRLLPDADPAQVASCPSHLAQDSLWTYTLTPAGLQAESDAIPFPAQRRLNAGRFADTIALTPPRALAPSTPTPSNSPTNSTLDLPPDSRYLVLTPSGVLVLDDQFTSVQLITPDWTHYPSLKEALSRTRLPQPPSLPALPQDFNLLRTVATPSGTYIVGQSEVLELPAADQ